MLQKLKLKKPKVVGNEPKPIDKEQNAHNDILNQIKLIFEMTEIEMEVENPYTNEEKFIVHFTHIGEKTNVNIVINKDTYLWLKNNWVVETKEEKVEGVLDGN